MMIQPQEDIDDDSEILTDSHHTPIVTEPSTSSQPQQKQKSKKSKKRITKLPQLSKSTHDVVGEHVTTTSNDPLSGLGDQKDASKQKRKIVDLDADEGVALVDGTLERNDQDKFDTSIFDDEEVVAKKEVSIAGERQRQRIEEENEYAKLKRCLEIIPDDNDDATIKSTPLSSKSPTIVDYKICKEGRKSFFKIIRADGKLTVAIDVNDVEAQIQALVDKKKVIITETSVRSDLYLEDAE
nr:hypothetical protein [Tanacetum cinerariifolium]